MTGLSLIVVCILAVVGSITCVCMIFDGVIGVVRFFRERAAVRRELDAA